MAIAISKTPTLRGKEAEKFRRSAALNSKRSASKKEVEKAVNTFASVLKTQDKHFFF